MSARASCSGSPSSPTTEPPKRSAKLSARSACRLATKIVPAPWDASARAVNSLVSPAPMMTTWRSSRPPTTPSARSTATEGTLTRLAPIAVSERTRLATLKARVPDLRVLRYRKPTFAKVAPVDLRHEISTKCDLVIEALAD